MRDLFILVLFGICIYCPSVMSRPLSAIEVRFLTTPQNGVFQISSIDGKLDEKSQSIITSWLNLKLKGNNDFKRNGNFITTNFNEQIHEGVKGCFFYFLFNKLNSTTSLLLNSYLLGNNPFSSENIDQLGNDFLKLISDSSVKCDKANDKNNPFYDSTYNDIQFYLSDKNQRRPASLSEEKFNRYDSILGKGYNEAVTIKSMQAKSNFKKWVHEIQNNFISLKPEVLTTLLKSIGNSEIQETEFAFRFMIAAYEHDPKFKESICDYSLLTPYIRASQFIYNECTGGGGGFIEQCGADNFGKNFVTILVRRENMFYDDLFRIRK